MNGTRNQVGRIVPSAPIGSAPMAADSSASEPASSRPVSSRTTGARAPPNVVQPTTPRVEAWRGR
jgi:hypothetical protein